MIFNILHFPKVILHESDTERYYTDEWGNRFRSVTQLLSTIPNPKLEEWKNEVGEREASLISSSAKRRGKILHKAIEEYFEYYNLIPYNQLKMPFNLELFLKFKRKIDKHLDEVNGYEVPLVSYKYNIAGTCDLIGSWNKIPSIIDFKTSKYEKDLEYIENYFLQKTIYSLMIEDIFKLKFMQLVSLIGVDHSNEAQVVIQSREKYEKKALELLCPN